MNIVIKQNDEQPIYPQLCLRHSLASRVISQSILECRYSSLFNLFFLVSNVKLVPRLTQLTRYASQCYRILDTIQFILLIYSVDYYLVREAGDVSQLDLPLWYDHHQFICASLIFATQRSFTVGFSSIFRWQPVVYAIALT